MADYKFYTEKYLGSSIPENEFPRLIKRAGEHLDKYKRVYQVTSPTNESESMALCAMADALYYFEAVQNGEGGILTSAKIGSVSESYSGGNSAVDLSAKGQSKELYRCASLYLDIYRGITTC